MGSSGSKNKKRNRDRTRLVNDAVRKKDQLLKVQNDARANKEEYKKLRVGDNKNFLKNNKTFASNKFANNNNC